VQGDYSRVGRNPIDRSYGTGDEISCSVKNCRSMQTGHRRRGKVRSPGDPDPMRSKKKTYYAEGRPILTVFPCNPLCWGQGFITGVSV